ncbi:MAG: hypothetical protein QG574_1706 [Cyanobacteriota bacterium erpe_2018_sw_21hr_WHONDRS-SW48-000092_B_bin.40]|jgi:DNA-binding NarL/FixJ family response regulator|nr:hypothetical protein [Cyanobacteriota bacterium erpe_2018_sw_21hr_WHONDRS-SW48-000092_B_bin.40]
MPTGSIFSESSKRHRPRAVICDSSESVRARLKEVLLSLLNVVGEAGDGSAAAEMIRRLSPDFVILDFAHNELDGVGLCRRITAQFPNLTILVCTSSYYATKYHNQLFRTVEKHIEVILAKLKVPTRMAAAAKAVEFGYVLLSLGESQAD